MVERFFAAAKDFSLDFRVNLVVVRADQFILMFIKPVEKAAAILAGKLQQALFDLLNTHGFNLSLRGRFANKKNEPKDRQIQLRAAIGLGVSVVCWWGRIRSNI